MSAYRTGVHSALTELGLVKVADGAAPAHPPVAPPKGQYWRGAWNEIRPQLFGEDPRGALKEYTSNTWWKPGSKVRNAMWAPGDPNAKGFGKFMGRALPAMNYLQGAFGLYGAYKAPSDQKGEAYGNAFGSIAGTALGMPFGLAGSTAGAILGGHLGGMAGKLFNRKKREPDYHAVGALPPGYNAYANNNYGAMGAGQQGVYR